MKSATRSSAGTWTSRGSRSDGVADPSARPIEEDQRRLQREDRQHLDQQRVDEEVGQIDDPLAAEHGLARAQGEEPLERDEDRRVEQQVQDEEIERQARRRRPAGAGTGTCDPPSSAAASVNPMPRQRQRLVGAQEGADAAEQKRRDERDVDDGAEVRRASREAAARRRSGTAGSADTAPAPKPGDAEERRQQAADEAVASEHRLRRLDREMRSPRFRRRISHAAPLQAMAGHSALRSAGRRAAAGHR